MSLQTNMSYSIDDLEDIIVSKETTFSHNLLENALDIHAQLVVKKVNQIKKLDVDACVEKNYIPHHRDTQK